MSKFILPAQIPHKCIYVIDGVLVHASDETSVDMSEFELKVGDRVAKVHWDHFTADKKHVFRGTWAK